MLALLAAVPHRPPNTTTSVPPLSSASSTRWRSAVGLRGQAEARRIPPAVPASSIASASCRPMNWTPRITDRSRIAALRQHYDDGPTQRHAIPHLLPHAAPHRQRPKPSIPSGTVLPPSCHSGCGQPLHLNASDTRQYSDEGVDEFNRSQIADRTTATSKHGENHLVAAVRHGCESVTERCQKRYLQHSDARVLRTV